MNTLIHQTLEGMQAVWNSQTNVNTLVPGGLWFARAPQDTAIPYGIVQVEEGTKTFVASGDFLMRFKVRVSIYTTGGPGAANAKSIASLMGEAFDFCQGEITFAEGRLLEFLPSTNHLELQDILRDSEDVLLTKASWDVMAQGRSNL